MFPALKFILKLFISVGLLIWLLSQTNWHQLLIACKPLPWWCVCLCVAIYGLAQWLSALRWQQLAIPLNFQLGVSAFFQLYLKGMFYNQVLPGTIGGDGYRIWQLSKLCQQPRGLAFITVLAERGLGLASLLWLTGLAAVLITIPTHGLNIIVFCLMGMSLLGYIGLILVPFRFKGLNWLIPAQQLCKNISLISRSFALSLIIQLAMIGIHVVLAQRLGISISPVYLAFTYGCVVLLTLLPISLNGLGLREVGYVQLLGWAGVAPGQAMALSLSWFLVGLLTSLLGALPDNTFVKTSPERLI